MSKLRFCGNCGLDLDQLPRRLARRYRRDAAHCPRCHASTDVAAYTLRRQNTAERLAAGPLIAPPVDDLTPVVPPRHPSPVIPAIIASLLSVIVVFVILLSLGVISLPADPSVAMHSVPAATSTPTFPPTTSPTGAGSGTPVVMTIQPYAFTVACGDPAASVTTTLANQGASTWDWSAMITALAGGSAPFQLTPMSGTLQPQTTQTLTISQIAQSGDIVIMANQVSESIIVTCAATTATPVGTPPPA